MFASSRRNYFNPDIVGGAVDFSRNNTNFSRQLFEHFKQAKFGQEYDFLKYYQNIARVYINEVNSGSRGLLVYHTMGMGKSILAVAIAMDQLRERQPIILLTKSLQENMRSAIHKYVRLRRETDENYPLSRFDASQLTDWINHNYSFVSMNASNMLKQVNKAAAGHSTDEFDAAMEKNFGEVLKLASLDGKLLIVDEAHNFFRAITNGSKNAIGLYDMIMKSKNLKILFLTGTPIANDPFELVPCFNMLAGEIILPESYKDFTKLYVDPKTGGVKNREKFQNRIFGMVSYVTHTSTPGAGIVESLNAEGKTTEAAEITNTASKIEFPEELPIKTVLVNMDPEQYVAYQLARDKEKEEGGGRGYGQASGHVRIIESPALTKPKSKASSTYRVRSRQLSNYCAPPAYRGESDVNKLPENTLESPKFKAILENINARPGQLGLVYSQFVGVGGLGTFARYLKTQGWEEYKVDGVPRSGGETGNEMIQQPKSYGSAIPSINDLLDDIEGSYHSAGLTKLHRSYNIGGDDFGLDDCWADDKTGGSNDSNNESSSDNEDNDNISDNISDITEEIVGESSGPDSTHYQFRYATANDTDVLVKINPNYKHDPENIKFPKYIIIVSVNDNDLGYIAIEYAIKIPTESDPTVVCAGRLIESHFTDIHALGDHGVISRKIISDAIKCRDDVKEFKKMIWGGDDETIDPIPANITADTSKLRRPRFAIISGEVDTIDRKKIEEVFNNPENNHGGIIDLLLVSSTGAEGLDLHNGRHIHMMEPYFTWGRALQINFRFVRNDAHLDLPESERNVQMYVYLAIPPATEATNGVFAPTTDVELYEESIKDQTGIESFDDALKEVSIECLANGEANCRSCNPTNTQLFSNDPERDARGSDPCSEIHETQVEAEEIIYNGETFYFTPDDTSIHEYRVFVFDPDVAGYRPMDESDPRYTLIVEAILAERSDKLTEKKEKS